MSGSSLRTIVDAFEPRTNILNTLQPVFTTTMISSHVIGLGYSGRDWIGDRTTGRTSGHLPST